MAEPYRPIPPPHRAALSDAEMLARAGAVLDRMRRRYSIRAFSGRPVPRAVIERCVAAAVTAPSGANQQPWRARQANTSPM